MSHSLQDVSAEVVSRGCWLVPNVVVCFMDTVHRNGFHRESQTVLSTASPVLI